MSSPAMVHLVGIANGQLWHTIQYLDNTFQSFFGNINDQEKNDPGVLVDVTCTWGWNQDLLVFALNDPYSGTSPSPLWYTIRHSDGTWQDTFVNLQTVIPRMPDNIMCVTSCGNYGIPDSDPIVHVCAGLNTPGGLWYTRYDLAARTWESEPVTTSTTAVGTPERIDAVMAGDGTLHVFFSSGGFMKDNIAAWHTSRTAQGEWQPTCDFIPAMQTDSDSAIYELDAARFGPVSTSSTGIQVFGRTAIGELIVAYPQNNPWIMTFAEQSTTGLANTVFVDIAADYPNITPAAIRMCVVDADGRLWYADTTANPLAFAPFDDHVRMPTYPFTKISMATF